MTFLSKTVLLAVAAVLLGISPVLSADSGPVLRVGNKLGSAAYVFFSDVDGKAVAAETYVVRGGVYEHGSFEQAVVLHVASPKCNLAAPLAAHYYGSIVLEPTCRLVNESDGREIPSS